ncbi:phospholipase D-like domain-containing protein [Candidatus Solirubrobacter pratensis]|uniref:hypothetical protein n=1 Tax=Candidatus Solirubrobacter pratensis TaxID=1298857 RepID=UPI00040A5386|nr:hypothetical protein [Candidatus Solirubrobacter pratensis]
MKVAAHFRPGTRAFWGTTYALELTLFDQYLLRQLGGPPLNVVVLADHWKLSQMWDRLEPDEHYLARQANRVYLLRGVQLPGGGAFHPKTFLFARRDEATLVIGSGNLTRSGLDAGKEVFTSFDTSTDEGLATLRAWARWIGWLVDNADDEQLSRRFTALREQSPWMPGPVGPTPFAVNDEQPLLEQFVEQLPGTVDELHVSAPYYDRDALALAGVLGRTSPKRLHLYLGLATSVHGPSLAGVLQAAGCDVHLHRFEPATFVHAKLVGAVCGDQGLLLCGSPNLSRAALTLTHADASRGNCEVALIRRGSADQVRHPFLSSGLELIDVPTDHLHDLKFDSDDPAEGRPIVALRRATWRKDGRIAITAEPEPEPGQQLAWAHGTTPLDGNLSNEALADHDEPPRLAWLADRDGEIVSNAVAIDDPNALDRSLASRDPSRDRPGEMHEQDAETPLGRLMGWLHQQCIFDIDETPAARRAQGAQDEAPEEESTDFWDRLISEELNYDPRTQNYRRIGPTVMPIGHDLFRELEIMLAKAPLDHPVLRLITGAPTGEPPPEGDDGPTGVSWSLEARQRVRVTNVLSRWCRAVSDPRHALLRPDAPAANYQALVSVLVTAWAEGALDEDRLVRLAGELFGAFLGDGKSPGFLGRADEQLRATVLYQLDDAVSEWAAALAYLALRPHRPWKSIVYEWQPYLRRGLIDSNVMSVGERTGELVGRVLGEEHDQREIEDVLLARAEYLDEEKWCEGLAETLGLRRVALRNIGNEHVPLRIIIDGIKDPLADPRVVEAALNAMRFRKTEAIGIEAGDCVAVLRPGHPAVARMGSMAGGTRLKSTVVITADRLAAIERQGGALSELLGLQTAAAA